MRMSGQRHASAALTPRMPRCPFYRRLGVPQDRSGRVRKILPPPRFALRTIQLYRPTNTQTHSSCAACYEGVRRHSGRAAFILALILDGGDWPVSRSFRFDPGKVLWYPLCAFQSRESNHWSSIVQPDRHVAKLIGCALATLWNESFLQIEMNN